MDIHCDWIKLLIIILSQLILRGWIFNQYFKRYKFTEFVFKIYIFVSLSANGERNMNTEQYLDAAFYKNISTSADKTFDFADGKSLGYRTVINGTVNVSFQLKTHQYILVEKIHINKNSTAPYLVKMAVGSGAVTPFSLLKEALEKNLGTTVDCWYENMAYLNADERVFNQLRALKDCGELVFTIAVRHIIFRDGQHPRVKYLLQAVDEVKKRKRKSEPKKPKVPKLNIEPAQNLLLTDSQLPDLGDLEAFLTSNRN